MIKGLDVVGFNYILQNDVDNRKKAHPTWKIVGTEETTGCGTRGVYFDTTDQPGHMRSMNLSADKDGTENRIERGWQFYTERPWAAGLFYWTQPATISSHRLRVRHPRLLWILEGRGLVSEVVVD